MRSDPSGLPLSTVESILVVDDTADDREMYAEFLAFSGYRLFEAGTGDAAYDIAVERIPDLVITDIRLRGTLGDGIDLTRRLKMDPRTRQVPVIIVSACAFDRDRARAAAAGCDAFLSKPCLPDALLAEAQRQITRARARVSLLAPSS
jgi:two-component system, cell cycle response regulator DivK